MGYKGNAGAFLRSIYDGVSNKVVFGDFSTEWFGQENGLKQGCVLSPTLFSVLMNDLVNMLDGVGIGIDVVYCLPMILLSSRKLRRNCKG